MEMITNVFAVIGMLVVYTGVLIPIDIANDENWLRISKLRCPAWVRSAQAGFLSWWLERAENLNGLLFIIAVIVLFCLALLITTPPL